jgi:hypothetical protein
VLYTDRLGSGLDRRADAESAVRTPAVSRCPCRAARRRAVEIVVVDDGSRDTEAVSAVKASQSLARLSRRRRRSAAAGAGAAAATASLCFTDDDCSPSPSGPSAVSSEAGADARGGATVAVDRDPPVETSG